MNSLAEGAGRITALDLALSEADADAIVSNQFETFAALFGDEWERTLVEFVKAAAAKDPTNPFFKNESVDAINGAVLELCRREERSGGGGGGGSIPGDLQSFRLRTFPIPPIRRPARSRDRGLLPG